MPAFHIEHFGCRAARADGEAVSERLRSAGLGERKPSEADVVVVNTCSVTAEADRSARAFIRRTHRANPTARIVVTGCYAQRAPEEIANIQGVSAVIGNSHKAFAPEISLRLAGIQVSSNVAQPSSFVSVQSLLTQTIDERAIPIWADDRFAHSFLEEAELLPGTQTRPNLKIQEGCTNRCTFCVIPQTRGHSRSLSQESILRHVRDFVTAGGKELVLSGINLGRWGHDLDKSTESSLVCLSALVQRMFDETALPRLRLSSIEPMDWSSDLLALYREFSNGEHPRLARHTHLPLQSGSDAILRRMYRRYRPWHYADRLAQIRAILPDAAIGADVMIGFPGESDAHFDESYRFIAAQPFTYLHLFPFSARPATPAWEFHRQNPVPAQAVRERMEALRTLMAEKFRAFRTRFLGTTLSAVTVEPGPGATTEAVTDNFLKLSLDAPLPANRIVTAQITALTNEGLSGSMPTAPSPTASSLTISSLAAF